MIDFGLLLELSLNFKPEIPALCLLPLALALGAVLAYITWTDAVSVERDQDGAPVRDEHGRPVRRHIIPNHVTYPGILTAAALSPVLFEDPGLHLFFGLFTGVVLVGLAFVRIRGAYGFGMGDAKLYTMVGFLLGPGVLLVMMLAAALGVVVGLVQARRQQRGALGQGVPHGPQIAVAVVIVVALALTAG